MQPRAFGRAGSVDTVVRLSPPGHMIPMVHWGTTVLTPSSRSASVSRTLSVTCSPAPVLSRVVLEAQRSPVLQPRMLQGQYVLSPAPASPPLADSCSGGSCCSGAGGGGGGNAATAGGLRRCDISPAATPDFVSLGEASLDLLGEEGAAAAYGASLASVVSGISANAFRFNCFRPSDLESVAASETASQRWHRKYSEDQASNYTADTIADFSMLSDNGSDTRHDAAA